MAAQPVLLFRKANKGLESFDASSEELPKIRDAEKSGRETSETEGRKRERKQDSQISTCPIS